MWEGRWPFVRSGHRPLYSGHWISVRWWHSTIATPSFERPGETRSGFPIRFVSSPFYLRVSYPLSSVLKWLARKLLRRRIFQVLITRDFGVTYYSDDGLVSLLLHLDVVAGECAMFRADHSGPMSESVRIPASTHQIRVVKTYHQSLSLSVFFSTVITSPFLKPKSPGCSASKV